MNAEQLKSARSHFPYLDKGIIYFNHASDSPISTEVKKVIVDFVNSRSDDCDFDYKSFLKRAEETKQILAEMMNCEKDRIAFSENTSTGLNILAQGIDWKAGDIILLNDVEFPANVYPFLNLEKKRVKIEYIKAKNGILTAEDVIESIKPQTKLISISFVQFLSGYRVDLEKIGSVCREKNIILSVDAIQGLGAVRLDVTKSKIDFLSCGTQKWMMGIQGLSFIYLTKDLQDKIDTVPSGWLSVDDAWNLLDYKLKFKETASRYQPGTLNTAAIYALNAALKFFKQFGFDEVERQIISNSKYFIKKLSELGYYSPLKNLDYKYLAGIVSIITDRAGEIFNHLSNKKIICSDRAGYLRFSPHFYNTVDEIDKVVAELKNISNLTTWNS
ncbi:MAG TPA: aminotransferase class V-fold PLP-dependent enzyme [Ignavibacteriaceae bacterium]|nr:aminotransferase class V-fold PLP-dependent enzyme [Ignavibacteriaceae bacterium]